MSREDPVMQARMDTKGREGVAICSATEADLAPAALVVAEAFDEYRLLFGDDIPTVARCTVPLLEAVGGHNLMVAEMAGQTVGMLQVMTRADVIRGRLRGIRSMWWPLLGWNGILRAFLGLVPISFLFLERPVRHDELYVATLGVRPAWQRRGIGRALLHHAEELATRQGFGAVSLHVASHSTAARSLYARVAYVVEREQRPPLRHRIGVDHYLLMRKEL